MSLKPIASQTTSSFSTPKSSQKEAEVSQNPLQGRAREICEFNQINFLDKLSETIGPGTFQKLTLELTQLQGENRERIFTDYYGYITGPTDDPNLLKIQLGFKEIQNLWELIPKLMGKIDAIISTKLSSSTENQGGFLEIIKNLLKENGYKQAKNVLIRKVFNEIIEIKSPKNPKKEVIKEIVGFALGEVNDQELEKSADVIKEVLPYLQPYLETFAKVKE